MNRCKRCLRRRRYTKINTLLIKTRIIGPRTEPIIIDGDVWGAFKAGAAVAILEEGDATIVVLDTKAGAELEETGARLTLVADEQINIANSMELVTQRVSCIVKEQRRIDSRRGCFHGESMRDLSQANQR